MTTNERLQAIEERYLGQGIGEFSDSGGNARDYAEQVFAREIFGPDVDPVDESLEILTADDLTAALFELGMRNGTPV